jgi:hypothetical protein
MGFIGDDWIHLGIVERQTGYETSQGELYRFFDGRPGEIARLKTHGSLPWWSYDGVRMAFMRPLPSLLWRLDHALSGRNATVYHIDNLLWMLLALAAASWAYRALLPARLVLPALLVFAVDPSHALSTVVIANRHLVVAGACSFAALAAFVRWRQRGRVGLAVLAWVAFALGLLASEAALGMLGFALAYLLVGEPRDGRRPLLRLRPLVPFVLLGLAYVAVHVRMGYGVYAVGDYHSPFAEPGTFLSQAPGRLLALLSDALFRLPSDFWISPKARWTFVLFGAVGLGLATLALARLGRVLPRDGFRGLLALTLGAMLALVPCLGGMISSRLLFLSSLGTDALIAASFMMLYDRARASGARAWPRRLRFLVAGSIAFVHGFGALGVCAGHNVVYHWIDQGTERLLANARIDAGKHVIAVMASDPLTAHTLVNVWPLTGGAAGSMHVLSMAPCDHELLRTGPRSVRLRSSCPMLATDLERYYRPARYALRVGSTFDLHEFKVTVVEVKDGRPTAIDLELAAPVAEYEFVTWQHGRVEPVALPDPGQQQRLQWSRGPMGL